MTGNSVKIEKFVLDFFEQVNNSSDIKKHDHIYNILANCSYSSENNILDKEISTLYFTTEQLSLIKTKQKELGYDDNLSRFVRYALFEFYMEEHGMTLSNKFFGELISCDKFKLLMNKCMNGLMEGKYTSYNLDLLRDNKKYEGKISYNYFNNKTEEVKFNLDFIEYDMLIFLGERFEEGKSYSEIVNLSTEQVASESFLEIKDGNNLEPFIDYDNIVPDTDSFYYLFLYSAFIVDPGDLDIDEIFNETEEHIDLLLKKYVFSKITKHFREKYNMISTYDIFDKECVENLLSNNIIILDDIIESNDIIKSNEIVELDENIDTK